MLMMIWMPGIMWFVLTDGEDMLWTSQYLKDKCSGMNRINVIPPAGEDALKVLF